MKRVAMFISCDSFEGFYGGTFGLDRETYLTSYRNDYVWEYAEGMRRCGHEVIIYILSYGAAEIRAVAEGLSVRFLPLPQWLRLLDPVLFRLRNVNRGSALRDGIAFAGYRAALEAALQLDRIDLLYVQEIWTPRFDFVCRALSIPIIGADHGALYADWMAPTKRISLRRARCVVCQSTSSLERARDFGGKAVLISNGVDTDFFIPPASHDRAKTVLAVGRLVEEQKRFSDLLRAMQALPDFSLVLVGSGPSEAMLKRLAAELGVADRVTFAGFVSDRKELRRLYQECGVFAAPSAWEAVALVMLEAMSCAAPVVGTRIPSFEDLLTDGVDALLVPVGAVDALADAIKRAHSDQHMLGAAARRRVLNGYASAALYAQLSGLIESA
jgi:glycosyltransferase involved in cell wall biosynthesis